MNEVVEIFWNGYISVCESVILENASLVEDRQRSARLGV